MTDSDFIHRLATEWLSWLLKDGRCYNSALAICTAGSVDGDCVLLITRTDRNTACRQLLQSKPFCTVDGCQQLSAQLGIIAVFRQQQIVEAIVGCWQSLCLGPRALNDQF